ncbi:heterokaryon incompatibility protein or allele [Colletotrichum incanum]|uniref:Heterokaryon incompatibility protein or allele n=1 Tax=Colletotrichum incanum TaxID=1573173 RepID=A0A162NDJ8_COLIC|nr:heterokaryon incompatibility protein or allele [Colletotrichum incanum]
MSQFEVFRYEVLSDPEREFRLLKILRSGEARADSISCELTTWPIQAAPTYQAISYTWGDSSTTRSITINGHQSLIRENCFYALMQAYSSPPHGKDDCYFWVDSICINQQDAEKNNQVKIMSTIYQNAANVLACVGEAADDSSFLCGILNRHATDLLRCSKKWRIDESIDDLFHQLRVNRKLGLGSADQRKKLFTAFFSFLKRPYFTRVWIMQELFMGKNISVCCGQDVVPFQTLDGLRIVIFQFGFRKKLPGLWTDVKLAFRIFKWARRWGVHELTDLLLSDLLAQPHMEVATHSSADLLPLGKAASMTLGLGCLDPRDNVYALSALIDWGEVKAVEPDYTITEFDLALRTFHKLAELELMGGSPEYHDPRVQLIPALGLNTQTPEVAEALRKRRCLEDVIGSVEASTETTSVLKKQSMFWLAWRIIYDDSLGWRLECKRPAPADPSFDKSVHHKSPPVIHLRSEYVQASVYLPPCVQSGDVLLVQGRFTTSLGSDEWLGLVARLHTDSAESSRRSIVGKAIVEGDLGEVLGNQIDTYFGYVFFDPEDLIVLTAAEQQHRSWEEVSEADRELYLKTRYRQSRVSNEEQSQFVDQLAIYDRIPPEGFD